MINLVQISKNEKTTGLVEVKLSIKGGSGEIKLRKEAIESTNFINIKKVDNKKFIINNQVRRPI